MALPASKVVLASGNPGKLKEMGALLSGLDIELCPQSLFAVPDVEETGQSFVENAILKTRNAARYTNLPAIADDSGIQVDVLGGAPGIYSARYAGAGASDDENLRLLLERLAVREEVQATACFQCVMVFLRYPDDAMPVIAQGTWHGYIVAEPRGENGFGYDPIFYVPTHGCTSAELDAEEKNKISHRGQAMRELLEKMSVMVS